MSSTPSTIPFQDQYLDARADCWGCGRNNEHGLHIKSHWEGDEAVAHFLPEDYFSGHKGVLNGGIIATLMDCHSIGLAMAYAHREEGRDIGSQPLITYVTGSLKVDYLQPTPLNGQPLELRAVVERTEGRKTFVRCRLLAGGVETARGEVLGVRIPEPPETQA
ncbi:MAG TPA: PaaI family thioesterase [Anaerolineales bacterium]|nr:PaaI family thioesterase [Anaerolineales bacterium]HRQ92150.1 PaaI family thioesterase [Anaerolineales bacterium]